MSTSPLPPSLTSSHSFHHLSLLLLAGIGIVLLMLMEIAVATAAASRAVVDTSRPFQSVREAVEVFGERCLSSSRASSESGAGKPPASSSSPPVVLGCLRKLEAELAEARGELERLRQRQSHMEMAVSSITAQLSTGLALLSGAARDKGKELAVADVVDGGRVRSDRWDESRAEEWMASLEYLPSLSEALAIKMVDDDRHLGERRQRNLKKNTKNAMNNNNKKKKKQQQQQQQQKKKNGISFVGRIFSSRKDKSR